MQPEPTTEEGLAQRLIERDPQAWEMLYRDLYPRLRAFSARRVGDDRALDVVAETMAKAVGSIERYQPGGIGVPAWVFGICRHVIADQHRAASRIAKLRPSEEPAAPDVSEGLEGQEERDAMRVAYQRLSEEDREILDLRVIAGLSAEDVGNLLDRKPGTVRMGQARALKRLRDRYEEVYE